MAINQDVQDTENYPGNIKRVTLDMDSLVPTGAEGDEKMMLIASTSAYSDITARTAIQSLYVSASKVGWAKSNGLAGVAGKFELTSTANTLCIAIDATISGTYTDPATGQGCYPIVLDYNANETPKSGTDIAVDMKNKIRALTMETADAGFQLAYSNCSVIYENGKFIISSGSIANSYTGADRSSVLVAPGNTNDCSKVLGFENAITSEEVAGISLAESYLTQNYTGDATSLYIGTGTGIQAGDAFYISNGTDEEYSYAIAVSGTLLTIPNLATNGFASVTGTYNVADGAYIQILRKQDPDVKPNGYFEDMDAVLRYMTKILVNQIDFSA